MANMALLLADLADPFKELIQIVIPTMTLTPGQCEIDIFSVVFQLCGQNDGDGNGSIPVSGTVPDVGVPKKSATGAL